MKLVESCKHCWAWNALNSNSWDFWVGASFVVWEGKKSSQESAGRNTNHNQIALIILSYILGISKRQAHPSERDIPGLRVSSHVTQCAFSPIHEIVLWPFAGLTIFMGKLSMLRTGSMPVVVDMQQSSGMRLGIPETVAKHPRNPRRIRHLQHPSFREGTSCGVSGWRRRKASNVAWRIVPDSYLSTVHWYIWYA